METKEMTIDDVRAHVKKMQQQARDYGWTTDAAALSLILAELDRLLKLREALPTLEQLEAIRYHRDHRDMLVCQCEADQGDGCYPDCWIARLTAALETE